MVKDDFLYYVGCIGDRRRQSPTTEAFQKFFDRVCPNEWFVDYFIEEIGWHYKSIQNGMLKELHKRRKILENISPKQKEKLIEKLSTSNYKFDIELLFKFIKLGILTKEDISQYAINNILPEKDKTFLEKHNISYISDGIKRNKQLHDAIEKEDIKLVKKMISQGADVNYHKYGLSMLCIAILIKNINIIRTLIQNGAKITVEDGLSYTDIYNAAFSNFKILELTIEHVSKIDSNKFSLLNKASSEDIIQLLLKKYFSFDKYKQLHGENWLYTITGEAFFDYVIKKDKIDIYSLDTKGHSYLYSTLMYALKEDDKEKSNILWNHYSLLDKNEVEFSKKDYATFKNILTKLDNLVVKKYKNKIINKVIESDFIGMHSLYKISSYFFTFSDKELDFIAMNMNKLSEVYFEKNKINKAISYSKTVYEIKNDLYIDGEKTDKSTFINELNLNGSYAARAHRFEDAIVFFKRYFEIENFSESEDITDFIYPFVKWYQCEEKLDNKKVLIKLEKKAIELTELYKEKLGNGFENALETEKKAYQEGQDKPDKFSQEKFLIFEKLFLKYLSIYMQ